MSSFPFLTVLIVVELLIGIVALTQFSLHSATQFQLEEKHSWIPQFGVSYSVGVDGIALSLILMALILTPICLMAAWHDVPEVPGNRRVQTYFALLLVLASFMVGVFAATDVFLFYVFFEAMLIPVYFLIGFYGGQRRQYAAMKFLLFSLAGGLIMLVGVIGLYLQGPGGSDGFLISQLTGLNIDPTTERLLFVAFFIAFAVKAPMVPVHTWLPDAATESTPATATLLVGVLDKVGTFGMIRFCLQIFPDAAHWATPVVVTLAVHFGLIVLGIFALTTTSWAGSSLYMLTHGFGTAALFLFAAMLIRRRGSKRIEDFTGWQRITPMLAGMFLIACMAGLALPGLASFVAEITVLVGSFQTQPVAAVLSTTGIILAAIYMLWLYKRMMTGPVPERVGTKPVSAVRDLGLREKLVAAPIIAVLLGLGFYPKPALDLINPAVENTLKQLTINGQPVHDPVPAQAPTMEGSAK